MTRPQQRSDALPSQVDAVPENIYNRQGQAKVPDMSEEKDRGKAGK